MALMSDVLSEKTKTKLKDDCVKVLKSVIAVLLGEISDILGGYSKDMASGSALSIRENCAVLSIEETEAK